MNTIIDLTTAQSALNYLRSLPADQAISLPGHYTESSTEGDAVCAITNQSAHEWAGNRRQWEWTAADLVATLEAEMAESEAERETADDERRITIKDDYDRCSSTVCLGDLTEKQYKALTEVARLSPGYNFVVTRYAQTDEAKGSSATHVFICKQGNDNNHVGLVGKNTVQYYDQDKATEAVVKRVAHRVYRFSGFTMV